MEPSSYTVLVVEDVEAIRKIIVTFLIGLGHVCVTAVDGVDALDKLKENKIDAVVADIKMPKMDGIMLTREISRQYPGIPIMIMTGFAEEYSAGDAVFAGAREFIQKPFSLDEFTIRFKKMLSDSKPLKAEKIEKNPDEDIHNLIKKLEAALK